LPLDRKRKRGRHSQRRPGVHRKSVVEADSPDSQSIDRLDRKRSREGRRTNVAVDSPDDPTNS